MPKILWFIRPCVSASPVTEQKWTSRYTKMTKVDGCWRSSMNSGILRFGTILLPPTEGVTHAHPRQASCCIFGDPSVFVLFALFPIRQRIDFRDHYRLYRCSGATCQRIHQQRSYGAGSCCHFERHRLLFSHQSTAGKLYSPYRGSSKRRTSPSG